MKNINEIEKAINNSIESLVEALKNGKSERFIEYLKFCSKFHNYSINNQLLIFQQMPNASRVAGFKTWEKEGFTINKGAKSLRILAPQKYKYIENELGERIFFNQMTKEQKQAKHLHKEGIKYKAVPVFDMSQCTSLTGDNEKTFFYPLGDTKKEQYLNLKLKIENKNIKVTETENTNGAEGVSKGGEILIKSSLDYDNKLLTLIHELAHEMLDKGEYSDREDTTREIRELRAESASYIVGQYIGLDNPFSSDYLLMYKADETMLKEHIEKIVSTSNEIIKMINE